MGKVRVDVDVDVDGERELKNVNKGLGKLDKQARKTGQGLSESAKGARDFKVGLGSLLGAGAIAGAAKAIFDFGKESFELYRVQEQAENQLAAAIKSTGGAAGLSARELKAYASELQGVSTFGDEAIIGAQSLLLTFTGIGETVFPRATSAILDMSQAMGQDLKSSTQLVGKALNDPIMGISALSRVGVQLTKQTKDQIRAFMDMGDIASAQGLILEELEVQFGGSAAAAAEGTGAITQLSNSFGDLQEVLGGNLSPGILEVTKRLTDMVDAFGQGVAADKRYQNALDSGFLTQQKVNNMMEQGIGVTQDYNQNIAELTAGYDEWLASQEKAVEEASSFDQAHIKQKSTFVGLGDEIENATEILDSHIEASIAYEVTAEQMNEALGRQAEAQLKAREEAEKYEEMLASRFVKTLQDSKEVAFDLGEELLNEALAAGATREEMILLAGATGDFTDAQIEAALKAEVVRQKVKELAEDFVAGRITIEEARGAVVGLNAELDAIPRTIDVDVNVNVNQRGNVFNPNTGDFTPEGTGGIPEFQSGGSFNVSGMLPNAGAPIIVHPNETVTVEQNFEGDQGSAGASIIIETLVVQANNADELLESLETVRQ